MAIIPIYHHINWYFINHIYINAYKSYNYTKNSKENNFLIYCKAFKTKISDIINLSLIFYMAAFRLSDDV